jgi:hypothetical protein
METHSLDLAFTDDRKSDIRHGPIAEIYVKTYSSRGTDGAPLITPVCVTIEDLEYQVDRLAKELDAIRTKARIKFAAEAKRF